MKVNLSFEHLLCACMMNAFNLSMNAAQRVSTVLNASIDVGSNSWPFRHNIQERFKRGEADSKTTLVVLRAGCTESCRQS